MAAGFCNDACAANLDDIYKPLLQKNRFLLESEASYYRMNEIGNHGSATYGEFKSTPDYMDLQNTLSFSITDSLNIKAGFGALLPAEYTRTTYNAAGGNDIQRYKVQHMYDFSAGARARLGQVDFFSEVLARRQRSTWDYAPYPNPTCFFTMIKSHSEDVRAGLRFITEDEPLFIESNLSKIKRPLLREKQVNLETNVTYRSGEALRGSEFFFAGVTRYNYFHDIKAHYEPELIVRYGIRDNLEAETGISYQTPLIYHLNADRFNPAGTTVFTDGIYKVEHKARIPCAVRYRADDKIEIAFSSPVEMAHQRLDYWQKQAGGALATVAKREA